MAYERIKTEHAGAKNGGGTWMTRAEAKQTARRQRRQEDEIEVALSAEEQDNRWATANARGSNPRGALGARGEGQMSHI
jgi:hypothetical protein